MSEILEINHLSVAFSKYETFFKKTFSAPIEDLSLSLEENTITAVVGQSGSGKSLVAHAIMGMLPGNCRINGELLYKGAPFTDQVRRSLRKGEIVIIPQSIDYLDPLMTVGNQIRELVREGDPEEEMQKILARYSLAPEVADMYPFELSGGMARRILIACAVVQRPALIIADEPTPGLDEELVDEAIGHMLQLKENGASLLVITHDLFVAQAIADKIVFFKDGKSVCQVTREEFANTSDFENLPPYAKLLFESLPCHKFTEIARVEAEDGQIHTLEAKNLTFGYTKDKPIFQGLNFSIKSGEIVGLTAHSGFGKSTLCKLLAGYLKPLTGEILIDGKPFKAGSAYNPVQLVFQHPEKAVDFKWTMDKILNEAFPVDNNIQQSMGLKDEWMERFPKELSGGELQRFSISRVLNPHTRFLIADEMTTMFDTYTQAQIWKTVIEFVRAHNLALILISHDRDLVRKLCDRVVALDQF